MSKKIWLVSFPRSGNTFLRNVLFHVYGITSLEGEEDYKETGADVTFVKSHLLPFQLKHYNPKTDQVIFVVRDGRDSICSLAHKRKNIIDKNSDLDLNFKEAIIAEKGSFFGGWGNSILFWLPENPTIIRFEELVTDTKRVFEEKLEPIIGKTNGNWEELPSFEKQKKGDSLYGTGKFGEVEKAAALFFRKGEIGNWKYEMKPQHVELFNQLYAPYLQSMGYQLDGQLSNIQPSDINKIKRDVWSRWQFRIQLKYWYLKDWIKVKLKYGI